MVRYYWTLNKSIPKREKVYRWAIVFLILILGYVFSITLDLALKPGRGSDFYILKWDMPGQEINYILLPSNLPPGNYSLDADSQALVQIEKYVNLIKTDEFTERFSEYGAISRYITLDSNMQVGLKLVFSEDDWDGCTLTLTGPYAK